MSKTYEFLKECGVFFVTTLNDNMPAARPFGAVMEYQEELYFSTANTKQVYLQLIKNPQIQIVALKAGTRDWVRINGNAEEVNNPNIKQEMLDACPVLLKRFESKDCSYFALFKITKMEALLNTNDGVFKLN